MKQRRARRWLIPLFCYYGIAICIYLGFCTVSFLKDHYNLTLQEQILTLDDLQLEGLAAEPNPDGGMDLVSTDSDPKILYVQNEPFYANCIIFYGTPVNKPGGEMQLYYTTQPGQVPDARHCLWPQQSKDGGWYFDLGGKNVYTLRLDPDAVGGVVWRDWKIVLNRQKPIIEYFIPELRTVFLLLFVPALVSALLFEAAAVLAALFLRREKIKREASS